MSASSQIDILFAIPQRLQDSNAQVKTVQPFSEEANWIFFTRFSRAFLFYDRQM